MGFFQAVKAELIKRTIGPKTQEELGQAIRQIVSRAVSSDEVIDIFKAAKIIEELIDLAREMREAGKRGD